MARSQHRYISSSGNIMYYGQHLLDKYIHENYMDHIGGFFIECGAFDGVTESTCKFFEERLEWAGINIEPVPYLFDLLLKNRPLSINVQAALSNRNSLTDFTHVIHPRYGYGFGNGSLNHTDLHKRLLDREGCEYEQILVRTYTYDFLTDLLGIKEVDLFVLDVEGQEVNVLQRMTTPLPELLVVEYSWSGLDPILNILDSNYYMDSYYKDNAIFLRKG